jgi:EmrB/QacA subfamily drug resistance transporter
MTRDSRWLSLYVLCFGMLMIVLDGTVVNVALPSIQRDFNFAQSALAWVVNAYLIAFAGFLLLSGRLGDLIGSKRVFICGLALFTASSLLCGLAWNGWILIAARFVQGIGGAMSSAVILAMIVTMFEAPGERTRAMGVFSFTAAAGGSIGLLIGGALTQALNWHWVFLVNVPIGIATIAIGQRVLTGTKGIGLREGADVLGAAAITLALMLGAFAVVEVPILGPTSMQTLVAGAASAALFAGFLWRQATTSRPLVPLSLFASRNLSGSNAIEGLVCAALFGFFFLDALVLRRSRGYDAVSTGLAFLPLTVAIGVLSLGWAETLTTRFGAKPVLIAGLAISVAGMAWFAFVPLGAYVTTMFTPMLLLGIGMGVAFPPQMIFAMSGTTPEDAGVASGVLNTSAQVGGAFGLAILATLSAVGGFQLAFAGATVALAASTVIAIGILRPEEAPADTEAKEPGWSVGPS